MSFVYFCRCSSSLLNVTLWSVVRFVQTDAVKWCQEVIRPVLLQQQQQQQTVATQSDPVSSPPLLLSLLRRVLLLLPLSAYPQLSEVCLLLVLSVNRVEVLCCEVAMFFDAVHLLSRTVTRCVTTALATNGCRCCIVYLFGYSCTGH